MSKIIAELTATINALGYAVNGKTQYFVDTECKEAIRELIRFLRRDDETHEIRRYLGSACILQTDLIPILMNHQDDEEILDLILRLLVNLTMPALLLYNEEPPVDRVSSQQYLSIVQHLQKYKQAFTKQQIWIILSEKLSGLLKMDWAERGEEKSLIIMRILILIRNVLHVPTDTDLENRPDNDANLHDQVLWALQEGGIIDLILYISSSEDESQYYFHILEITSLMLRDQNAEVLASASVQRSLVEKQRDTEELIDIRKKEKEQKLKKSHLVSARYPRFVGTYVVKGIKSIADNDVVVHSLNDKVGLSFDRKKNKVKTPKNRRPMESDLRERRSAFSVRVLMKELCIEFLNGAYNNLMHYVREMLHRGKAQSNDESYFFWALRFFMEFNRNYKFEVKLISETMHVSIFHFTQERIEAWRANMVVDKKKIPLWSKRMHLGVKAYKELLLTLMKMYLHADQTVKESAHTIMSNIFYVVEYREFLMVLLNVFDELKFSREYLKDLIEANHVFMKLLEHFCKRHRTLVVQKKNKALKRKKKTKDSNSRSSASSLKFEPTDEKWKILESKITELYENGTELSVQPIPFDAASDVPFEEQKIEAMRKIRFLFLNSEVEEAIGLLRACREVWPENDCFGNENMLVVEECAAFKEIFFADIGLPAAALVNNGNGDGNENAAENDESDDDEEEDDGQSAMHVSVNEQNFEFMEFMKKFAKPKIVYACCLLLSQYETNTVYTNHCLVKLLHRIAFDCKYAAILFQATVFRTFLRILNSNEQRYKELKQFAVHIIRKFTEVAKRNTKVYIELLFWKGNKEAYEIVEGYGTLKSKDSTKLLWTEEQEDELRRLHEEYEKDKPEREMVDWIQSNMIDQTRSRKGVMKKLRELGVISAQAPVPLRTRPPKEFSEEEIVQITNLFNEFKDAVDTIGCIMERLEVKRPKVRIVDKIVELGLVHSRSELRKKRIRKSRGGENEYVEENNSEISDAESEIESAASDSESGDDVVRPAMAALSSSLSSTEVIDRIRVVVERGMKNAVDWILSCFEDALEDIGDEESDVPILPLADFTVTAMDNDVFQRFLLAVGVKRPSDHQEIYWRIPGSWLANDLRKRITLIRDTLNGNVSFLEVPAPATDQDTDRTDLLASIAANSRTNVDAALTNDDLEVSVSRRKVKRKRFDRDEFRTRPKSSTKKKKMSRMVRDDESDAEELVTHVTSLKSKVANDLILDKEADVHLRSGPSNRHHLSSDDSDREMPSTSVPHSTAKLSRNSAVLSSEESDVEIPPTKSWRKPSTVIDQLNDELMSGSSKKLNSFEDDDDDHDVDISTSKSSQMLRILSEEDSDCESSSKSSQKFGTSHEDCRSESKSHLSTKSIFTGDNSHKSTTKLCQPSSVASTMCHDKLSHLSTQDSKIRDDKSDTEELPKCNRNSSLTVESKEQSDNEALSQPKRKRKILSSDDESD